MFFFFFSRHNVHVLLTIAEFAPHYLFILPAKQFLLRSISIEINFRSTKVSSSTDVSCLLRNFAAKKNQKYKLTYVDSVWRKLIAADLDTAKIEEENRNLNEMFFYRCVVTIKRKKHQKTTRWNGLGLRNLITIFFIFENFIDNRSCPQGAFTSNLYL